VSLALACTEDPAAPGRCPDFCPGGQIGLVDTLLATAIERDSAFRGYLQPRDAVALVAASLPGVLDSRPVLRFQSIGATFRLGTDTTSHPIVGADSARLTLTLVRRDTLAGNLRLQIYRLPVAVDSATTFGDLTGPFTDSLIKSVNVDSLIAAPNRRDDATGDSVFVANNGFVRVMMKLDSAQARFVAADSGTLAYGIRLAADTATSAAVAANASGESPLLFWYFRVDSASVDTVRQSRLLAPQFNTYVFDPPLAPLDSTLAVGGMPSARSLLRVNLPAALRDSTQILRATLLLVPSTPAQGAPIDSFTLVAHAVAADLGAKSPLAGSSVTDSSVLGTGRVIIGSTDTVRVEITRILRRWAGDTLAPNALFLRSSSEGLVLTEIRFQPSAHATLKPVIRLTYAPRFPFGAP
jgi:hypothetical protein